MDLTALECVRKDFINVEDFVVVIIGFFSKGQNDFVEWKDLFFRSTPSWTSLLLKRNKHTADM